ncbi:MAG: hypothetical protein WHS44_11260 [Fimbriimonadales bacterium]|nr:MAG: hypothetical protein KatS3mg018_0109 [Fimbriimonadales bacterium]
MRYITLKQAAQKLGLEEQALVQWAQQGFLPVYRSEATRTPTRPAREMQLLTFVARPAPDLYFAAEDIEELAEDLAWSRMGRRRMWDDDEDA